MNKKEYRLNDIPRFSPWPARLLGLEPWQVRKKTPGAIIREFNAEKWGSLLEWVRSKRHNATVEELNNYIYRDEKTTLLFNDGVYTHVSNQEANDLYLDFVAHILSKYLEATSLVEFGAGYGNVILNLGRRQAFNKIPLIAGEYTKNGVELIRLLAANQGTPIKVGNCDLSRPQLTALDIPEHALIFTSFACMYVKEFTSEIVNALWKLQPHTIVHFEPCYEHCSGNSLLDLMRRRYIEVNDYNKNLISILRNQYLAGKIRFLKEYPCVFGHHPLSVASVIVWSFNE